MQTLNTLLLHTPDINLERLEALKKACPDLFTNDGQPNIDEFRKLFGPGLVNETERYDFRWYGKSQSKRMAFTPSRAALLQDPARAVNPEKARGNMIIEGENLEVLKLLNCAYRSRVKLIYIDPPYNTGRDFVYSDNYTVQEKPYWELTSALESGVKVDTNPDSSGRFHSAWLSLLHSRLLSARYLLHPEGFIVVSIDDAEFFNLSRLMDEVFGEENFVATLVWDKNRKNDAKFFSVGHEYMLVYAKDRALLQDQGTMLRADKEGVDEVRERFEALRRQHADDWDLVKRDLKALYATWPEDDPRLPLARFDKVDAKGPFRDDGNINWPYGNGPDYEILHPVTNKPCKLPISGWRYANPDRFWQEYAKGRIVFGPDETTVPSVRYNLFDTKTQVLGSVHYSYAQTAAQEFEKIFGGSKIFENPKHFEDLKKLIDYLTDEGDIVLDFFAGSGSTAHATMLSNAQRQFILVQLPEAISGKDRTGKRALELGFKKISDITIERCKRVITGYDGQLPLVDSGFKVFTLTKSLFPRVEFAPDPQKSQEENIALLKAYIADKETSFHLQLSGATAFDEVLLKNGFLLDYELSPQKSFPKNSVFLAKDAYKSSLICLDPVLDSSTVDALKSCKDSFFICLELALDTTKKWNLKHNLGDKFKAF